MAGQSGLAEFAGMAKQKAKSKRNASAVLEDQQPATALPRAAELLQLEGGRRAAANAATADQGLPAKGLVKGAAVRDERKKKRVKADIASSAHTAEVAALGPLFVTRLVGKRTNAESKGKTDYAGAGKAEHAENLGQPTPMPVSKLKKNAGDMELSHAARLAGDTSLPSPGRGSRLASAKRAKNAKVSRQTVEIKDGLAATAMRQGQATVSKPVSGTEGLQNGAPEDREEMVSPLRPNKNLNAEAAPKKAGKKRGRLVLAKER